MQAIKRILKKVLTNILPFFIVKYIYRLRREDLSMGSLSYNRFQNMSFYIRKSIHSLPHDIDLVVGIPRSGMIPAYMIALFLNKPCCSITEFKNGICPENGQRSIDISNNIKKILIVDDSVLSGRALKRVKNDKCIKNMQVLYYAVFVTDISRTFVDFYGVITDKNRIFQWNYTNHSILRYSCVDIDGVLCVDPEESENDDGEAYKNFILTAKPLYVPKIKIHALVTSRLEKYRYETEVWLKNNNIEYDNLIMLNLESKEERQALHCHAQFKASIYKKDSYAKLFIESNDRQAREIARLSHKPCICVETDSLYLK